MTFKFSWSDKFLLGVKKIDEQHMELINQINKLVVVNNMNENTETIKELVTFLKEYVVYHFTSEEELQLKYAYPHYKEHRIEHFNFLKKVVNFESQFLRSDSEDQRKNLLHKMNGELVNWLSEHINDSDRKVAEHLLQQKNS